MSAHKIYGPKGAGALVVRGGSESRLEPLILGGAIMMLRPLKAALIALQYKHNLLHHNPPSA